MGTLTAADRNRIRTAIHLAAKERIRLDNMLYKANGKRDGRCKECGTEWGNHTLGCLTCNNRHGCWRRRNDKLKEARRNGAARIR